MRLLFDKAAGTDFPSFMRHSTHRSQRTATFLRMCWAMVSPEASGIPMDPREIAPYGQAMMHSLQPEQNCTRDTTTPFS